jgi:hypothetical protein
MRELSNQSFIVSPVILIQLIDIPTLMPCMISASKEQFRSQMAKASESSVAICSDFCAK